MYRGMLPKSRAARAVLGLGAALVTSSLPAVPAAHAFDPPAPVKIDGGPLGELQFSAGADGFLWALTGAGSSGSYGLLGTSRSAGVELMNGLVELQKADGLVRGTIIIGANNSVVLGEAPHAASITTWATGPVHTAFITLAPSEHFSFSAGHLGSLEGYESNIDWNNFNILTTDIFAVQNSQSTGVSATVNYGPVSATITFGDGFDTQVWNYLQMLATYNFNSDNALTLFGSTNLGTHRLRRPHLRFGHHAIPRLLCRFRPDQRRALRQLLGGGRLLQLHLRQPDRDTRGAGRLGEEDAFRGPDGIVQQLRRRSVHELQVRQVTVVARRLGGIFQFERSGSAGSSIPGRRDSGSPSRRPGRASTCSSVAIWDSCI